MRLSAGLVKIFSVSSYSTSRPQRFCSVGVELDHQEGGPVGDPRRLLHVVGDDHDRELLFELDHQVLDLAGRDRVERRAGLVHQDHVGLDGDAAGDAEPLLLAAGHAEGVVVEAVLDLVPERRAAQRLLDRLVEVVLLAEDARAEGDVVVDRLRERVRFLEDHPDQLADLDRVDVGPVEVLAVVEELAVDFGAGDQVVHPVEAAQQGALAAARGTDQRGDVVAVDVHRHALDGGHAAVEDVDALQLEDLFLVAPRRAGAELRPHGDRRPARPRASRVSRAVSGLLSSIIISLDHRRSPTTSARSDFVARSRTSSSPAGRPA